MAKYSIESDSITGLMARIVFLIRFENPTLGGMNAVCLDGSRVNVKLRDKEPLRRCLNVSVAMRHAPGIRIDGRPVPLE